MPEPRQVVITFLNGDRAEYPLVTVQPLKLVSDMVQDEEEDKDVTQAPIEIPLPACNKPLFDDVFELLVILQETGPYTPKLPVEAEKLEGFPDKVLAYIAKHWGQGVEHYCDLVKLINYLDHELLLISVCAEIARLCKDVKPSVVVERFQLTPTDEQLKLIKEEEMWV